MSSTDSSSTDAGAPRSAAKKGSAIAAVITISILALLVWGLNPRQPRLRPAPLEPERNFCTPTSADFVPTNLTEIPNMALDALPPSVRNRVLLRLNMEPCSCGCKQSLAACRTGNPSCPVSPHAADAIVKEESAAQATPAP